MLERLTSYIFFCQMLCAFKNLHRVDYFIRNLVFGGGSLGSVTTALFPDIFLCHTVTDITWLIALVVVWQAVGPVANLEQVFNFVPDMLTSTIV